MSSRLRTLLLELASPLMLAAYAAWAAVWLSSVDGAAARDPALGWLARSWLLLFLAGFVGSAIGNADRAGWRRWIAAATMALAAFGLIALGPSGSSPILLVLLAGMLASMVDGWRLAAMLLAVNAVLLAILLWGWEANPRYALTMLAAYASFQLFAALVMRSAERAEAMAAELREVNAELLGTRSLLEQSARDAERLRLSRELHDIAGHGLTALKLNLGALARDPRQPDPERVRLCAGLADDLLQNLRGVVRQMRQQQGLDLREAITRLSAPFATPAVHLEIDPTIELDRIDTAEAVLRTVQEGLTNAVRHSGAGNLWIVLQRDGDRLRLELRDDGRGSARLRPGSGLSGMRERLQAAGGDLDIEQADGSGLRLHAWLPLEHAA